MNWKRMFYLGTRLSQVLMPKLKNKIFTKQSKKNIIFYPAFNKLDDIQDQINRIRWYIPKNTANSVSIFVNDKYKNLNLDSLSVPEGQRTPVGDTVEISIGEASQLEKQISNADIICIWNTNSKWIRKFLRRPFKIRIVDPNFYLFTETHTYPGILWHDLMSLSDKNRWSDDSRKKFIDLFEEKRNHKAYVFGTGPSINSFKDYNYQDGIKIICNSIIKNDEMLEYIKPDILVFTDSVFHFGASEYSENFTADVLKVVKKYGVYCVTNEVGYAILRAHYPELEQFMIAVPAKRFGKPQILTPSDFSTRDYANVLTRYMLPLAAGLADEVALIGFDGRNPDENYFWKHNKSTQYSEAMDSTQITHPAFFRDVNYDGYYEQHCENLEKIFSEFERNKKIITVLGNTYIPAMKKRMGNKAN